MKGARTAVATEEMAFAAASLAIVVVGLEKPTDSVGMVNHRTEQTHDRKLTSWPSSASAIAALPDAAIASAAAAAAVRLPVAFGPFAGL